ALSHVLGQGDLLVTSRSIYGGAHQLIHDWYAKPANLGIAVETFDGWTAIDFEKAWEIIHHRHAERLAPDAPVKRHAYLYLESPSNPHGYVLDVPGICKA